MPDHGEALPHWIFLKGNHEELLLDAWRHCSRTYGSFDLWWLQGGRATAESYFTEDVDPDAPRCAEARAAILAEHFDWLEARPLYHETDRYIFAHAGLRPTIPLAAQDREDLLWIRADFHLSRHGFGGKRVVFGHTAFRKPRVEPNKLGIDTMRHGQGMLTAVELGGPVPMFYHQPTVADEWPWHTHQLPWRRAIDRAGASPVGQRPPWLSRRRFLGPSQVTTRVCGGGARRTQHRRDSPYVV